MLEDKKPRQKKLKSPWNERTEFVLFSEPNLGTAEYERSVELIWNLMAHDDAR